MHIGDRIQAHRLKSGLSQEALAERLGVTRQSVSKWELAQALPDIDKIILLCKYFNISTDELLFGEPHSPLNTAQQMLHWGLYLIVKNFDKSIDFYERFFNKRASIVGIGRFAQFWFDNGCLLSIMNERHLPGHDYTGCGHHKFVLNLWVKDLAREYYRVKNLNIGHMTGIRNPHSNYHFFNLTDPDKNIIEITGEYYEGGNKMQDVINCQSCYMPMDTADKFGTEADGNQNKDYCCHCWKDGKFTYTSTLEQAVEDNIPWWKSEEESDDVARARIMEIFPKLKRWANS